MSYSNHSTQKQPQIRVGIVDDSLFIRQLIRQVINDVDGMAVVGEASNPYEAREMIKDVNPDVITLDIEMPKMDGLTLAQRLRSMEETKHLPVIGFSSTAGNEQFETKARDAGINHMVSKTERHALFEIIAQYAPNSQEAA